VSDETVWFDPNEEVDAYRHSKRLAERAAWDFARPASAFSASANSVDERDFEHSASPAR
jgi:hypothetical protein